jgi:nitroreductase/NAD-dependent dihydropyrimidine dehydrogenase PreA subunit
MKIKGIDDEKCIKCVECVKECPSHLFIKPETPLGEKRHILFEDPYNTCIECGHCLAICPTAAVLYEDAEKTIEFEDVSTPSSIVNYDDLIKILRSRRAIRRYESKPVPKEEISAVIDAMRYAPSARNAQSWGFIVLTDKEKIDRLKNEVIKMMVLLRKLVKYRKLLSLFFPKDLRKYINDPSTKRGLDDFFDNIEKGVDEIFYNAPVIIILYSPDNAGFAGNDAGIAFTYGMLAAQARNLGSCWIGYAQEVLRRYKKNRKWLEIPDNMNAYGVLIIGYPAVKYYRVPPRESLKIKWN